MSLGIFRVKKIIIFFVNGLFLYLVKTFNIFQFCEIYGRFVVVYIRDTKKICIWDQG
jgi:hypothetical protein